MNFMIEFLIMLQCDYYFGGHKNLAYLARFKNIILELAFSPKSQCEAVFLGFLSFFFLNHVLFCLGLILVDILFIQFLL